MKKNAKKAGDLNVMKTPKKIKDEHLQQARHLMGMSNHIKNSLGQIEIERIKASAAWAENERNLEEFKTMLRGEYGDVNVNLQDGSIEELPKENEESK